MSIDGQQLNKSVCSSSRPYCYLDKYEVDAARGRSNYTTL